ERTFSLVFEKYPWFKLFNGKIVSSHVKLLKPEKEIYEALIKKYSLNPDECIFIDDTHANIIAGEKLGIKGIHYTGQEELREMLKEYIEL
ncbi:MAG: HAD-IA family hydrolase, partial [Fusobacteriaceae bacterium]|nr:HAD-IA family hydrolase [Fusobacteriaceae bacterium]